MTCEKDLSMRIFDLGVTEIIYLTFRLTGDLRIIFVPGTRHKYENVVKVSHCLPSELRVRHT